MINIDLSNFSFFFDFINLFIIFLTLFISFKNKIINKPILLILSVYASTPLFGNDVLFDFYIFPDQSKYLDNISLVRNNFLKILFDFESYNQEFNNLNFGQFSKMKWTAIAISLTPIPFIESIRSLGFFSKFIFFICFLFILILDEKRNFKKNYFVFLILALPSILIYSSVGLKEMFVIVFFHSCMFFILEKKVIFFLMSLLFLFAIRVELTILILIFLISYFYIFFYLSERLISKNIQRAIKVAIGLVIFLLLVQYILMNQNYIYSVVDLINLRKMGYYGEGDLNTEIRLYSYDLSLVTLLKDIMFAIITPTLSKSNNTFLFIFIIENIIIISLYLLYFFSILKINLLKGIFYLFFFILLNLSVGMVVVNDFAIYRYKISMFIPLILIMRKELINLNK